MSPNAQIPRPDSVIDQILAGYREGAFPMAVADDDAPEPESPPEQSGGRPARPAAPALAWYEADPRGIIRLDPPNYHIPRRLAQTMRSARLTITSDQAFARVIRACADPRREGAWINRQIIDIFEALHNAGLAHSVEAWLSIEQTPALATGSPDADADGFEASDLLTPNPTTPNPDAILHDRANSRLLVGGLYGLRLGSIFCGEAMFSRPDLGGRDASKVCLASTILHLRAQGFALLDTQMHSDHLAQFGCEAIDRESYHDLLLSLRDNPRQWGTFTQAHPPHEP